MPKYKKEKLEADARKNWDLFYKRNRTNFFKDRQWMTREFEEFKQLAEKVNWFYFYKKKHLLCYYCLFTGLPKNLESLKKKTGV